MGGQDHFYLEGQIALARPMEDGQVHLLSSTQHPSEVQHLVAHLLGRSSADVTVEVRRMGGAFGGKESQASLYAAAAALVAHHTGRPAKFRADRDDDMVQTGKRHDFVVDYEVGFDDEGISGLAGAPRLALRRHGRPVAGDQRSRDVPCRQHLFPARRGDRFGAVEDQHGLGHGFRGFGGPQGMLAIERVMDAVAGHLGCDPLAVRVANLYGPGRDVTPYGMVVADNIAPDLIAKLRSDARYDARQADVARFNAESPVLKKGLALTPVKFGISFTTTHLNQAGALLHVYADGRSRSTTAAPRWARASIPRSRKSSRRLLAWRWTVRITATRTDKVPNTSATAASSGPT
jgi:xanthine dehydrogenase large subunit